MLKKAKAEFGSKQRDQAKQLSQAVLNSSHQIWLAGLGAFARAQAEGTRMFDTLVQQGEHLESRTRQAAADTATAARSAAEAKAREMQKMAGGTWDKLEKVFEDRVARTLSKLGMYTRNDVERLAERVDALSDAVNRLIKSSSEATPATARRSTGRAKKTTTVAAKPNAGVQGKSARKTTGPAAKAAKTGRRAATST